MSNQKRLIQVVSGLVVVALIIVVIVCGVRRKVETSANPPSTGKVSGTITFAEGPTAQPNWIFRSNRASTARSTTSTSSKTKMFRPMYCSASRQRVARSFVVTGLQPGVFEPRQDRDDEAQGLEIL